LPKAAGSARVNTLTKPDLARVVKAAMAGVNGTDGGSGVAVHRLQDRGNLNILEQAFRGTVLGAEDFSYFVPDRIAHGFAQIEH
jgi:hypothetical protein